MDKAKIRIVDVRAAAFLEAFVSQLTTCSEFYVDFVFQSGFFVWSPLWNASSPLLGRLTSENDSCSEDDSVTVELIDHRVLFVFILVYMPQVLLSGMTFVDSHHMNPVVVDDSSALLANGRVGPNSGTKGLSIPDRVALLYYKHGLLCSSYPWWAIAVAIVIILTSCHPLLTLPFPGNEPEEISFPQEQKEFHPYPTRWRAKEPSFYIQQIIIRSSVSPWTPELGLMDAFRGPLGEVFKVHSEVVGFHSPQTNRTLRDVCLYVEGLGPDSRPFQRVLPEFGCLVLSPANLWRLDETTFRDDALFLDTIFSYKNPVVEVRSSMADLVFGVSLTDSGLKRYPVKTRSRVLTFAMTVVLKSYSKDIVKDLGEKLYRRFPLHAHQESTARRPIVHIYYPERFNYLELIPLSFVYCVLFLYIYFSVRKIEMVKSKLGMAFSAVVTVLASLGMSVGLCTWFGLRFSLQGRDIFPYLVVIIGLENILVLTRSVVSTPVNLDVKIRVAQGLSREGWNITKNLLTEVTILTVGFFTFVPAIQEVCLFAVVALLSDFILQMLFFTTVLSIDILRMELSEIQRHRRQLQPGQQYNHPANGERTFVANPFHPHLRPRMAAKMAPQTVVAPSSFTHNNSTFEKIPRRLKIVHFLARTRFFQRTLMVVAVIWMGLFLYECVIVERFNATPAWAPLNVSSSASPHQSSTPLETDSAAKADRPPVEGDPEVLNKLQHPNLDLRRRLSYRHWPDLLDNYNYSLAGSSIALLPPIRLSIPVHPDRVADVRNSLDGEYISRSRWKSLANALDSLDVLDGEDSDFGLNTNHPSGEGASYVPTSTIEIILTTLLAIPSIAFISYVLVVLYRCICSRHYAEWRSSSNWWGNSGGLAQESREYYSQIIAESMPLVLDGHRSPVECISTDGDVVSSVCLAGQLHIWDIQTGDATAQIDRSAYFSSYQLAQHSTTGVTVDTGPLHSSSPVAYRSPTASPNMFHNDPWNSLQQQKTSPVWCMQCFNGLVALGCANGRIEIWNQQSRMCCLFDDGSCTGVAKLKVCGEYLLAARLNGALESFQLEYCGQTSSNPWPAQEEPPMQLVRLNWARAHQQPVSVLDAEGGRVVTGSQDHCIKVWRLETLTAMYSLHGHCGPITALFIDSDFPSSAAGSGSQDGMLCMWDLSSGTCVYSLQAHDGSVAVLTYTSSYVISLGTDDKLCVWERFQGHLLNTLPMTRLFCGSLAMLNDRLLVTSRQGSGLVVWDVRTGESIREVQLGDADGSTFVRHVLVVRDSVICDYGTQLRIVSFPMISTQKVE